MEYPEIIDPENAHALLKAIYQCSEIPLPVRMRAAIAAIPFESPKLIATAVMNEGSFADLLDRRLKRIDELKTNPQVIEASPVVETTRPLPRIPDRRYRRF